MFVSAAMDNLPKTSVASKYNAMDNLLRTPVGSRYPEERGEHTHWPWKNPLKWYRENKDQYPFATKIYIKYASIQATSVPSERVFNIASMTFDDRPNLLPEKAEISVVLSDYYRRKDGKDKFTLCQDCKPARYKVMCMGHRWISKLINKMS